MKTGCENQKRSERRSVELPVLKNSGSEQQLVAVSKTSRWRAAALIGLNLLMAAHLLQWWIMGETISPIEPSESMFTLQQGAVNAGVIFFSLAILATSIFGRFVCGWGCHIVALQDLCAWILKKFGLRPRPFRSRLLVFVPLIVALYMFVWPTVVRYFQKPDSEPLIPAFTNHLVTTEFWATFPPLAVAIPFLFICGFMTVYFLGSKGFCTYACPYGGFFGVADKVAPGRIRVTDACNQCGHCTATCTSNVLVHAEVKQFGMVVDPGCMKCMDCISVCPNDALYFGFGKPAFGVKGAITRNYSLTWPEEIAAALVFLISFLAVWDVYHLVPMLMALGVATVSTFLALRIWRLYSAHDVAFYKYSLKTAGNISFGGWVFAVFAIGWLGLNIHSGWVRYHEREGAIAFERLTIPDELALAGKDPSQWLSGSDQKSLAEGKSHFELASKYGLFLNKENEPKLAWVEYLSGQTETALDRLESASKWQTGQARALSLYYLGAILNRSGKFERALADLDKAIAERPDLIAAREERGVSLWQLGRRDEAETAWADVVKQNPAMPLSDLFLAGASSLSGDQAAATKYQNAADSYAPDDAYFQWMLGLRLQNVGMYALSERYFGRAVQLDPQFRARRALDLRSK